MGNVGENDVLDRTKSNDSYVCHLPFEVRKIAQRDLSEEENTRTIAIKQIKDWILSNANIKKCRMDNSFLLRFLRTKKFRLAEAQQLMEKYLKMRTENPHWFSKLDVRNPRLKELIDRGFFFALPERDDFGRRVFFSVAGSLDTSRDTAADMMRGVHIGLESLIEEEENQVRGFTYIFDEKNVGLSVVTLWTPGEITKAFHCSEKTIPVRHKEIHLVHLPLTLYAVFEFAKALLSDKIKKRFQVHNNSDHLHKSVPKRILPKEYGGIVPVKSMIESYKQELEAVRSKVLSIDEIQWIKASKHKKLERTISNTAYRSFRKVEID